MKRILFTKNLESWFLSLGSWFLILGSILILPGCSNPSGKAGARDNTGAQVKQMGEVYYDGYCNERYGYCVDYPDFLIPQGEADNGDGQQFISEDGWQKMWVYRDAKMDIETGAPLSLERAYRDDLPQKKVTGKELSDNHYFIKGKKDGETTFQQYTLLAGDDFFTIYLEYPDGDDTLFNAIAEQASGSFSFGAVSYGEFFAYLSDFLNECYYNVNFNTLLRDKDKRLAKHIDPNMDVRRYHAPGAMAKLYNRADNFGFDEYTDFETMPEAEGEYSLQLMDAAEMLCDLDFEGYAKLYYHLVDYVPEVVVNTETFELAPVDVPYPDADIMVVYLPDRFSNPRAFYFFETPSGWKLAFVDDSLCGA